MLNNVLFPQAGYLHALYTSSTWRSPIKPCLFWVEKKSPCFEGRLTFKNIEVVWAGLFLGVRFFPGRKKSEVWSAAPMMMTRLKRIRRSCLTRRGQGGSGNSVGCGVVVFFVACVCVCVCEVYLYNSGGKKRQHGIRYVSSFFLNVDKMMWLEHRSLVGLYISRDFLLKSIL